MIVHPILGGVGKPFSKARIKRYEDGVGLFRPERHDVLCRTVECNEWIAILLNGGLAKVLGERLRQIAFVNVFVPGLDDIAIAHSFAETNVCFVLIECALIADGRFDLRCLRWGVGFYAIFFGDYAVMTQFVHTFGKLRRVDNSIYQFAATVTFVTQVVAQAHFAQQRLDRFGVVVHIHIDTKRVLHRQVYRHHIRAGFPCTNW